MGSLCKGWMTAVLAAGVLLGGGGCKGRRQGEAAAVQQRIYHLRGKIVAEDASSGEITVSHEAIPGFMEAMTMPYRLVEPETISELHVGDIITARVVVEYDAAGPKSPRLDDVVVVGQARPDTAPKVQYHVPQVGEAVPDFKLLNQSGRTIDLKAFRGKAVLLTFIYTRCPLAEFCPRMSDDFAAIDKELKADPAVYRRTHLLSVSFDPKYDTPAVLRSYGGAHTGRFTDEDFAHWEFAAPSEKELPDVEHWFDVGVTAGKTDDPSTVMHSLSTVLIGRDGKVLGWYPTNDWKPAEMAARMKQAAES